MSIQHKQNTKRTFSEKVRIYPKIVLGRMAPRYQKILIFEQPLAQSLRLPNLSQDIEFKVYMESSQIETLINQRESWYRSLAEVRFQDNNLCFVGEYRDKIISCLWTSFESVYLPNVEYTLHVEKRVVPLIDGWTAPEFRGKGTYNLIWNKCLEYLRNLGNYTSIYGFIQPTNERSLQVHKKIKLDNVILTVTLFKLFGVRFHKLKKETLPSSRSLPEVGS
jgi:RimJ/RimL family protein N-acetyltransferase